ncbi:hypothetical protein ACFQY7_06950 [Actinomadura luteofluorescens]|uniref:hypothetical protein n=1 Tax=Actinomadura luteofluorescens TaxID=46163 RepID=UPI003645ACD3
MLSWRAAPPSRSRIHRRSWAKDAGTGPVRSRFGIARSGSSVSPERSAAITARAVPITVGSPNRSLRVKSTPRAERIRDTSLIARSE